MNMPSHYQSAFFSALRRRNDIDLEVRYFECMPESRRKEGWIDSGGFDSFEASVNSQDSVKEITDSVSDWRDRIHIIGYSFHPKLVEYFCTVGVRWCHWSEMPGLRLAEVLQYNMPLFHLLNHLMLLMKYKERLSIRKYGAGAFGQGVLAQQAFRYMGIPEKKIAHLYYAPNALSDMPPSDDIQRFSKGRKVFLSVGILCKRKGTDILLKAFAALAVNNWCLILCGLDKSGGEYQQLAEHLGLNGKILFLGSCPVDRIASVYKAADVCVLSSRFDGWGAVLNEAASLGKALIGTDMCGASWHVIKEGVNGYCVKSDSVKSLKNAMDTYVNNPDLIVYHGRKSREIFFEEFTPERNAERLVHGLTRFCLE
jgi:glycosyltransferase involved in cell wall biosynthesis